ncbi:trichohyalin-like [Pollicipes pollicipes]|uniref:trichohyalin-like n=1 Tax=Pollicipes pollicipes TaxID=41117 RepID=UPI001884BA80|nr:trichohyalin-like [Pollicipes pollicipes]
MSSARVQRSDFADFQYQEAVGRLRLLLTDCGFGSGRGSDAGSVCSVRQRGPAARPELARFRSENIGFSSELTGFRPEMTSFRMELSSSRPELSTFRPETSSFRPELSSFRPRSALAQPSRRLETLGLGSASLRAASPLSVRSLRHAEPIRDGVDGGGGGGRAEELLATQPDAAPTERSQMTELRQYALRQAELTQQLEQENGHLREMTEELRRYVRELVTENGALADDLRRRATAERAGSETSEGGDARLEACRAEVERLSRQIVEHEEQLNAVHARQLHQLRGERDQLVDSGNQLKASLEERRKREELASQRAAESQQAAEQARLASAQAENTAAQLRRELEERERRADQLVMEHQRHLMAAREQAEQAVRATFDKLRGNLDRQAEQIAEMEAEQQRHARQVAELRAEVQQQQQAAAQARLDADSAASQHRQELELLQRRSQMPAAEWAGGERLRTELEAVQRKLAASEAQLASAQRERGRLQQQVRLMERKPAVVRDIVDPGQLEDGMKMPTRETKLQSLIASSRASGSAPAQHQAPEWSHQRPPPTSGRAEEPGRGSLRKASSSGQLQQGGATPQLQLQRGASSGQLQRRGAGGQLQKGAADGQLQRGRTGGQLLPKREVAAVSEERLDEDALSEQEQERELLGQEQEQEPEQEQEQEQKQQREPGSAEEQETDVKSEKEMEITPNKEREQKPTPEQVPKSERTNEPTASEEQELNTPNQPQKNDAEPKPEQEPEREDKPKNGDVESAPDRAKPGQPSSKPDAETGDVDRDETEPDGHGPGQQGADRAASGAGQPPEVGASQQDSS